MSPLESVPPALLRVLNDPYRTSTRARDGELYCVSCEGVEGELSYLYGHLVASGTLGELLQIARVMHADCSDVKIVDRDNCQFGM